ncbi:hypothetical protein TpMuguga_04g00012 [Theileria parva strain Muguga]|uniref:SfiI-subtelomeric related protein family member n=1 Tax=Theileria parva TaxID=5875 RepID=Q4N3H1_THEPA|nr:uncharacterized protein TpMuguga_04g00012 [Theileria parva strain Muguga]EAN31364.1 hypothetical protein TpMuguga_04g00012 [Theileria parva strain Muguga]|eukprot:XP_763647.1 hypothetical protein [Theileria parva strain Muguga]
MNGKLIIAVNLFFYITLLGQWKGVGANQTSDSSSATPASTTPDPTSSTEGTTTGSDQDPSATAPDQTTSSSSPDQSAATTAPDPTSSSNPDQDPTATAPDSSTAPDDTSATTPDQTAPDATSPTDQDPTASESTDPSATSLTTAPDSTESTTDQSTSESATETDQTLTVSATPTTPVSTDSAKGVTLDVNKTESTAEYECTNDRNFHKYVPKNGGVFGKVVQGSTVVWESDGSVYGTEVIFVSVTKYLIVLLDNNKFSFFKYYFARWNDMTNKRYDVSKLKLYGESDKELSSYDYRVNLRLYSFRYEFNEGVKCLKVKYGDDVVWKDSDDSDFKSVKMFLLDLPSNNFFVKNHSDKVKRVCPKPDQDASESTAPDSTSSTDQDQSATAPDSSTTPDATSSSTPAATSPDQTTASSSSDQAAATTGSDQDSGSPTAASSD